MRCCRREAELAELRGVVGALDAERDALQVGQGSSWLCLLRWEGSCRWLVPSWPSKGFHVGACWRDSESLHVNVCGKLTSVLL